MEEERFLEVRDNLERMGFDVSCSGGRLLARGIPPSLSRSEAGEFLREVLAGRKDDIRAMFISLSCKGAIKAGQRLADDEAAALLRQWLHTPEREYCLARPPQHPALGCRGAGETVQTAAVILVFRLELIMNLCTDHIP